MKHYVISYLFSASVLAVTSLATVPEKTYPVGTIPSIDAVEKHQYPDLNKGSYYKIGPSYTINGKTYKPKYQPNYKKEGMASWYGPGFHGKMTANGDTFDQHALTAAHATLPLPSIVEVTNLKNGKKVRLLVNDRGPYRKDRIIDVSKAAAKQLDFKDIGHTSVRVKYLKKETIKYLKKQGLFEQFAAKTKQNI